MRKHVNLNTSSRDKIPQDIGVSSLEIHVPSHQLWPSERLSISTRAALKYKRTKTSVHGETQLNDSQSSSHCLSGTQGSREVYGGLGTSMKLP